MKKRILVFTLYLYTVFWFTVLKRTMRYQIAKTEVFWSYRKWFAGDIRYGIEIIGNIAMFMPLGFLLSYIYDSISIPGKVDVSRFIKRYGGIIAFSILCTLVIETLQLLMMRGMFELDDLISNTLGTVLGICFYEIAKRRIGARIFSVFCRVICIVFAVTCCAVLLICRETWDIDADDSAKAFCFQVDEAEADGDELVLRGFVFQYGRPLTAPVLVMRQTETGEEIELETVYGFSRPEVNAYFQCGYDYTDTGFEAAARCDSDVEYEVMVKWPLMKMISTGVFVAGEDVHYVPYGDGWIENHEDANLNEADFVSEGTLLVARPDYHCWVYQYDGALYWIVDGDFVFEEDGITPIQYELWTTQDEKLPRRRIESGYHWDKIVTIFEKHEVAGDFGEYRVMRRELPTEYSVTAVLTGYYSEKRWVWKNYFRPIYEFRHHHEWKPGAEL